MPILKKVKKPKAKPKAKPKPKNSVTIIKSEKQKQAVNVNVQIDQSKKGKSSGGGSNNRLLSRQPANIINFPSNYPVSEIRYNPEIRYLPAPSTNNNMTEPAKVTENNLVKNTEPNKIYRSPERDRPIAPSNQSLLLSGISNLNDNFPDAVQPRQPSVLGTVSSVGSALLSDKYPEYKGAFELANKIAQSKLASTVSRNVSNYFFGENTQSRSISNGNIPSNVSSVYSNDVYDWLGYNSEMDNSTIATNTLLNENNLRNNNNPVNQTLISQLVEPVNRTVEAQINEEPPFIAGAVGGRVMGAVEQIEEKEKKERKKRDISEYDLWRKENKGRYKRSELADAWRRYKNVEDEGDLK